MKLNSAIYQGAVRHRRFSHCYREFSYSLYMLAIDLDEIDQLNHTSKLFGTKWYHPIRFKPDDYLKQAQLKIQDTNGEPNSLKQRIQNKVAELGGSKHIDRITMLAQGRCFGLYFSPVNFYFCYQQENCRYMLAEVSNTPWNERHYYLVDLTQPTIPTIEKDFHVSPFMNCDMQYHWRVKPPAKTLLVHIENHNKAKLFDATLALNKKDFSAVELTKAWIKQPVMTLKILLSIYWQALKLVINKVPFVPHPNR